MLCKRFGFTLPRGGVWGEEVFAMEEGDYCTSVPSPIIQVAGDLQTHADRTPLLLVNMVEARRRLAGVETSDLLRWVGVACSVVGVACSVPAQGFIQD